MKILKPYMNDTIAWLKVDSGEYFMKILNNFNDNIRFTHKEEVKSKLNITFYQKQNGERILFSVYEK